MERDLLPMARSEGMGIAPWGAIGQGKFQRKAEQGQSQDGRSAQPLTDNEKKVSEALEKVADELGVQSVTSVALAWVIAKYPYTFPIIGGRKVE
jgi:aryl-alcohol dehydrogenase-like predicted oxidoreductase